MKPKEDGSHSDFDMMLVVILLGLLGIGILIWMFVANVGKSGVDQVEVEAPRQGTPPPTITISETEYGDENLQIVNHEIVGTFLLDPETQQVLYVTKGLPPGSCDEDCASRWTAYERPTVVSGNGGLAPLPNAETGNYNYLWNGRQLYLYNEDAGKAFPSFLGDGADGFTVARP